MGINVKVTIEFNKIMEKLHKVAKDFADKRNGNIVLNNLAFNEKGEFRGSGEYCIFMNKTDGKNIEPNEKKEFLSIAKEYITYFLGEEEAEYIGEDDILPIKEGETSEDTSDAREEREKREKKEQEDSEEADRVRKQFTSMAMESEQIIVNFRNNKIVDLLFESEPPTTEEDDGQEKIIGFGLMYDLEVGGKKKHDIKDAINNSATGLLGGILADLRNIKIKIGNQNVNLGHVFDPQKWKEMMGMKDIDINRVPQDIANAFKSDYPNSDVPASNIKVWKADELITHLNREKKLTPEIKAKINTAEYSIVITVKKKDPNYPNYDKKTVAKTVSKALGTTYNVVKDWNKVTKDDIIKVDDIQGLYKLGSNYDNKQKKQQNGRNNTDNGEKRETETGTKKKTTSESIQYAVGTSKELVETLKKFGYNENLSMVFERGDTEDTSESDSSDSDEEKHSQKEIVDSDEYTNQVVESLNEQTSSHLSKLGEDVKSEYLSVEDCIKKIKNDENIDNLEFIQQLKELGEKCVITTITKDVGSLNEGLVQEKNNSKEEKSPVEIQKDAIKHINVEPGNEEASQMARDVMLRMVDSQQTIQRLQQNIQDSISLAYKNTFIKVSEKHDELKGIKPEYKVFQINKPIEEKEESVEFNNNRLLKLLFEGENNNSPYNTKLDKEKEFDAWQLNNSLIGAIVNNSDWSTEEERTDESQRISENVDKPSKVVKGKELQSRMGSRVHITPYACAAKIEYVIDFMKHHSINTTSFEAEKKNYKYCAIVIKKKSLLDENDKPVISGGNGHQQMNDGKVQEILDDVFRKTENKKINVIKCTKENPQNAQTMNSSTGELIEQNLGFFNKKNVEEYKKEHGIEGPIIPDLDVWVRPFNIKEDRNPEPENKGGKGGNTSINISVIINNNSTNINNIVKNNVTFVIINGGNGVGGYPIIETNMKIKFIFIMPDPIIIYIKNKGEPIPPPPKPEPPENDEDNKGEKKNNKSEKIDWYIVVMKSKMGFLGARKMRDMGNRAHQSATDNHGITTTHTSNSEYKPR